MNGLFEEKYDELFTEFNRDVVEHPEFAKRIPADALVVLLDKRDPEFNRENLRRVQKYIKHDDKPDRPVVYVQVGRLAPIKSRLRNPRLTTPINPVQRRKVANYQVTFTESAPDYAVARICDPLIQPPVCCKETGAFSSPSVLMKFKLDKLYAFPYNCTLLNDDAQSGARLTVTSRSVIFVANSGQI